MQREAVNRCNGIYIKSGDDPAGLWTRSYESVQDPTGILWNPYQFWK